MKYTYDSWNRIQKMTYPDGEVVEYDYNFGGMLKSVIGSKNSLEYMYIKDIYYNQFELKHSVLYGNGSRVNYEYDSLQRLSRLYSWTANGDTMQKIAYTYDSASNITEIYNTAPMLNTLGGKYKNTYTYDPLYRLTNSTGWWSGTNDRYYQSMTQYHSNGRIYKKNLAASRLLNGVSDSVNYSRCYYYENVAQKNTLTRISSGNWSESGSLVAEPVILQFAWDATGNLTTQQLIRDNQRFLCWDEQNRLQGVKDNNYLSYYQYDANGDRTYKLTGKGEMQNISGEWQYYYLLENATLYASPYLVATRQGYTKHYYAESERIASRIGGGNLQDLDEPVVGQEKILLKKEDNKSNATEVLEECLNAICTEGQTGLYNLYNIINSAHSENDCYWYHPDHLGSSSWITYTDGSAVQHLHYLPWGEDFVDQRTNSFDGARFTFSAKERDSETGLSYFGSRYYSSDLSIWLSVDPMAAKYASLSPYTYCTNNPVKLVDPNGEEVWIPGVDEKGNVTYTAEAGDNLGTFASQFDCRDVNGRYLDADGQYISERIFKNAKLSTTEDIKEGTVIKGEHVKEATNGSDVLKGNWWKMNDSQKASQIMFALMYGANKKHTLPNGLFGIDLNDFINGFYSKDGGSKYYNVTIPLKGGDKIVVDMWLAPFTAFEGEKGSLWVETSPEWGDYNDARSADPARFRTAKNANADRPMKVITFSVPANRRNDFNNSLKR